jgi:hypothetical protein
MAMKGFGLFFLEVIKQFCGFENNWLFWEGQQGNDLIVYLHSASLFTR